MTQQKAEKKAEKEKKPSQYECEFLVWSGSRNHPKATVCTEIGEIRGSWFFKYQSSAPELLEILRSWYY